MNYLWSDRNWIGLFPLFQTGSLKNNGWFLNPVFLPNSVIANSNDCKLTQSAMVSVLFATITLFQVQIYEIEGHKIETWRGKQRTPKRNWIL